MRTIKAWIWQAPRGGATHTFPEGTFVEDKMDGLGNPVYFVAGPPPPAMIDPVAHDFTHSGARVPSDIVVEDSVYTDAQDASTEELEAAGEIIDAKAGKDASTEDVRPSCPRCSCGMRCEKNDVTVEGRDNTTRFGDLFRCTLPGCTEYLVRGVGQPVSVGQQDDGASGDQEDYDLHLTGVYDEYLAKRFGLTPVQEAGITQVFMQFPGVYEALCGVEEFHNEAVARCELSKHQAYEESEQDGQATELASFGTDGVSAGRPSQSGIEQ